MKDTHNEFMKKVIKGGVYVGEVKTNVCSHEKARCEDG